MEWDACSCGKNRFEIIRALISRSELTPAICADCVRFLNSKEMQKKKMEMNPRVQLESGFSVLVALAFC